MSLTPAGLPEIDFVRMKTGEVGKPIVIEAGDNLMIALEKAVNRKIDFEIFFFGGELIKESACIAIDGPNHILFSFNLNLLYRFFLDFN